MSFEWKKYRKEDVKDMRDHIFSNPYGCDDCGDIYNKNDLYKQETGHYCKKCLSRP